MTDPRPTDREPATDPEAEPTPAPAAQAAGPRNQKQPTGDRQAAVNRADDPPA